MDADLVVSASKISTESGIPSTRWVRLPAPLMPEVA